MKFSHQILTSFHVIKISFTLPQDANAQLFIKDEIKNIFFTLANKIK